MNQLHLFTQTSKKNVSLTFCLSTVFKNVSARSHNDIKVGHHSVLNEKPWK